MLDSLLIPVAPPPVRQLAPRRDHRTLYLAIILGCVGVLTSAFGSWIPSFWGDEAASVMSAERPLPLLFRMLGNVDAVHGTYYLFLHFWIDVYGASAFSVRFPSALAVGVMLAGFVLLAERLAGHRFALIAGIICLVLPRVTYMGSEARSYAISAMCAVWLTLLFVELLSARRHRTLLWAGYIALTALSAYVFLFTLLILLAHGVMLIVTKRPWRMLRNWVLAIAAALVLASPVLFWSVSERKQIAYLAQRDATDPWELSVNQWFGNIGYAIIAWALILFGIGLAVAVWRRARAAGEPLSLGSNAEPGAPGTTILSARSRMPGVFLVSMTWAFVPPVVLLCADVIHPVYSVRYMSFAAPAVAMLLALVICQLARRWLRILVFAMLIAAAVPSYVFQRTPYAENNSDWAEVAQTMGTHARPGDAVVFDESTIPSRRLRLAMRTYPASFAGLNDVTLRTPYYDNTTWYDSVHGVKTVKQRFAEVSRVWLLEYKDTGDPVDRYGMSSLEALGFRIVHTYPEHTSVIYELDKAAH